MEAFDAFGDEEYDISDWLDGHGLEEVDRDKMVQALEKAIRDVVLTRCTPETQFFSAEVLEMEDPVNALLESWEPYEIDGSFMEDEDFSSAVFDKFCESHTVEDFLQDGE